MFVSMAITFLILAVITGVLGFLVMAGAAAWIKKAASFIFLVALGVALLMNVGQTSNHKKTRPSP